MINSTVTTNISAAFLATVLVAGIIALSSPSFIVGAQAVPEYGNDNYEKSYEKDNDESRDHKDDKKSYEKDNDESRDHKDDNKSYEKDNDESRDHKDDNKSYEKDNDESRDHKDD